MECCWRLFPTVHSQLTYNNLQADSLCTAIGGFFILTVQASIALLQRPRHGGKVADNRLILIAYIFITFVLGTIGFAANAKYTQMIWIDLRNAPGGPVWLIDNEMNYPINVVALARYATFPIHPWTSNIDGLV